MKTICVLSRKHKLILENRESDRKLTLLCIGCTLKTNMGSRFFEVSFDEDFEGQNLSMCLSFNKINNMIDDHIAFQWYFI